MWVTQAGSFLLLVFTALLLCVLVCAQIALKIGYVLDDECSYRDSLQVCLIGGVGHYHIFLP